MAEHVLESSALDHSAKLSFDARGRLNIVIRLLTGANVDNQLNLEQEGCGSHTCIPYIYKSHSW